MLASITSSAWKGSSPRKNAEKAQACFRLPDASKQFYKDKIYRCRLPHLHKSATRYETLLATCTAVSQSIKDAKGSMTIPSPRLDVGQLENEPFVFSKEPHYLAGKRSLAMARTPAENKRSTCGIVQSILTPNQDNPALTFTSMANVTTQRLLSLNKRGFGRKFDPDLKLNAKPRSY